MKFKRFLGKLNALVLISAMCTQTIAAPLVAQATESSTSTSSTAQKVYGQISGSYNAATNQEVITLDAYTLKSDVKIQYITMPDGSKSYGASVSYNANSNGSYAFTAVYEETVILNSDSDSPIEYTLNGEQGFRYTVSSIISDENSGDTNSSQGSGAQEGSGDRIPSETVKGDRTFINGFGEEEEISYTRMSGEEYLGMIEESPSVEYYTWLMDVQTMAADGDEPVAMSDVMVISSDGLTFNASTQTITGYSNLSGSGSSNLSALTIPAKIDGVDVLHIASSVFYGSYYIGTLAFEDGCKLQTIGYRAFRNSYVEGSVTLPSTVTTIGEQAFYGSKITSMTIPGNVTRIEAYTFYSCTNLERVSLPESLTYIGSYAFMGSTLLMSVNFPSKLTTIDSRAFRGCTALLSAALPATLTTIGSYAFYDCQSLANVTFAGGIQTIGSYAFYNTSIPEITFPATLKTIGTYAFQYCSNLTTVTAMGTIEAIGNYAFSNTVVSLMNFTGNTSSNLTGSPWGATTNPAIVWQGYAYKDNFILDTTTLQVVGFISDGRESQEIPAEFTDASNKTYKPTSIADSLFSGNTTIVDVTLPSTITSIGYRTFYNCTKLASINMPDDLITVGNQAFYGCSSISDLRFGSKVQTIGTYAFYGCTGVGSINIPDSVTTIGVYAFYNTTKVVDIVVGTGVTVLNNYVFGAGSTNSALKTVTLKGNIGSVSSTAFYYATAMTELTFTGVTEAQFTANGGSTATQWGATNAVVVWSDTTYFDGYIFDKSTGTIKSYKGTETVIIIPEEIDGVEVKHIGASAFYANTGITDLVVPDTVLTIGATAFYRCTKLRTVEIGAGITSIGANAFAMQSTGTSYTSMTRMVIHGLTGGADSIAGTAFTNFPSTCVYYFTQVDEATGTNKFGTTPSVWAANSSGLIIWGDMIYQDNFILKTSTGTITAYKGSDTSIVIPDEFYKEYAYDQNETTTPYLPLILTDSLFSSRTTVTSVYIPDSIIKIGNYAFASCTALQVVSGGEGIKEIGNYAFRYNYALLNAPLYDGLESIGIYAFQQCNALSSVIIPDTTTLIGNYAFYYCSSLSSITFGKGITDIHTMLLHMHMDIQGRHH